MAIERISAVTLATRDMDASVAFYRKVGFQLGPRGKEPVLTTLYAGEATLNLIGAEGYQGQWWGRVIFHVDDVDLQYEMLVAAGLTPDASPQDAPWGERFFHLTDPDGHELSFAQPLASDKR